jgi:hypothetical protein
MIKSLFSLANHCDRKGWYKQADALDELLNKIANDPSETNWETTQEGGPPAGTQEGGPPAGMSEGGAAKVVEFMEQNPDAAHAIFESMGYAAYDYDRVHFPGQRNQIWDLYDAEVRKGY